MWTRLHFGCPEYSFFEATAAVSLVDWHDVVDVISMPDLLPRSARRFVSAETLPGISHIGSLPAQRAAQTRWEHHSQVLQGQSIAGLSNKRCVCSRRAPFLSVFIVLVSPASGVKAH